MATLSITNDELTLTLTAREKVAGLHGDVRVPVHAIESVDVVQDPVPHVRGLRAPGLSIPWRTMIGTWLRRGGRSFVVARRDKPAVRVRLTGTTYDELLVSTEEAAEVAHHLRASAPRTPSGANFRERQVGFSSAGLTFHGTLTEPAEGTGPFPAALILPGSGEVDRDSDHRRIPLGVSRDLAVALARQGVASLRYDKRGVGRSGGEFLSTGLRDNLDDAGAALRFLASDDRVREDAIVLIGHSEGASHAMELGARTTVPLAGVVLLAAFAKTGEETLTWQARQILAGLPKPARLLLRLLRIDALAKQRKAIEALKATTTNVTRVQGRKINARWHRELLAFDPAPALRELHMPVLAVTGAKDIQVDPADLETIAATVPGPVKTVEVPDLTHLLRRDPGAPSLSAYKKLARQPLDGHTVDLITTWIRDQVNQP